MANSVAEYLRMFYELHRKELFAYAVALTGDPAAAEDASHEAFASMLARPELPREPRPYIFRCVRNAVIDEFRRSAREVEHAQAAAAPPGNGHAHLDLREALAVLNEEERDTITLKIYGGLTFSEISLLRETSLNTVASWYRRGLGKLRAHLEKET
ncbi:MAG: RNA polymerase sigma factor [Candidatus Hydrogenedentes bacterium]|nr:RNA polymerase sigma factor [Candidatus Hydrogenedentota bacterium]